MADSESLSRNDERISYRGPVKRLLVSPEIGALIGTIVVWAIFWGNGDTFGTAGSTSNFLDVAAPLGIMAIAVALLMIGGEFDLSSGVITGATGVTIALMAKYFTADGSPLWLAIAAANFSRNACGDLKWPSPCRLAANGEHKAPGIWPAAYSFSERTSATGRVDLS